MITVSTELAPLKVITKEALLPSATVAGLEMLMVGVGLLSIIVPVPKVELLEVLLDVTVPVKVKFSLGSSIASVRVATSKVTEVCPAGIVTVVVTEVKSEAPAVPTVETKFTTVAFAFGEVNAIVNTALEPSVVDALEIVNEFATGTGVIVDILLPGVGSDSLPVVVAVFP